MAGYVLVGTRTRRGVTLVSVVLGTPSLAARDHDALALLKWGAGRFERIHPVTRGSIVGTPEIEFRRGATLTLVTEGSVRRTVRAGRGDHDQRRRRARRGDRARSGAASASATARCSRTASGSPRCRSSRRPRSPPRTCRSAPRTGSRTRSRCCSRWSCSAVRCSWRGGCAAGLRAAAPTARSRKPHDPDRHAQHRDRQDARGAELPPRPPPPHGRADDDAGRQGRQRRARAQDARRAGDRDGAGRRRDRDAAGRAAHAALRAVRLRADPRGVAHQHGGDRPDDGRADRDQRARPVGLRAGDRAVRRQAALPRQGRVDVRLRRLAPAQRRRRRLRRPDPRAQAARRRLPSSTPTATRCAARCAPSPT